MTIRSITSPSIPTLLTCSSEYIAVPLESTTMKVDQVATSLSRTNDDDDSPEQTFMNANIDKKFSEIVKKNDLRNRQYPEAFLRTKFMIELREKRLPFLYAIDFKYPLYQNILSAEELTSLTEMQEALEQLKYNLDSEVRNAMYSQEYNTILHSELETQLSDRNIPPERKERIALVLQQVRAQIVPSSERKRFTNEMLANAERLYARSVANLNQRLEALLATDS